jgi:hypothetical protein
MRDSLFRSYPTATEAAELATTVVTKRLAPGAAGTRRLQQHYGKDLVCVRYRETADGSARFTTIELVVERRPATKRQAEPAERWVRIGFDEAELRQKVKAAGRRWDPKRKLWRVSAPAVRTLRLKSRLAKPTH